MCLFKNRIHEHFNINSFKDEESDKMSADSAHIQETSGGESTNSPILSGSHSLTIDAKYVLFFSFFFLSIITIFRHYVIDDYHLTISIMRIPLN